MLLLFVIASTQCFCEVIFQSGFEGYSDIVEDATILQEFDSTTAGQRYPAYGTVLSDYPIGPSSGKTNANSWNGHVMGANSKLRVVNDVKHSGDCSMAVLYAYPSSVTPTTGIEKYLGAEGYDEIYIKFYVKLDDTYRFGTDGTLNYWKWMRVWCGTDWSTSGGYTLFTSGANDEWGNSQTNEYWFNDFIMTLHGEASATDLGRSRFFRVYFNRNSDSNNAPWQLIDESGLTRLSDNSFRVQLDSTSTVWTGTPRIRIQVNGTQAQATITSITNNGGGQHDIVINSNAITSETLADLRVETSTANIYGPMNTVGDWKPITFENTQVTGQLSKHIGYTQSDGYFYDAQTWHSIEIHLKLNTETVTAACQNCISSDCSSVCSNNGVFEVWVDGDKAPDPKRYVGAGDIRNIGAPWINGERVGGGSAAKINFIRLFDNSAGMVTGWEDQKVFYVDDVVISTTRVTDETPQTATSNRVGAGTANRLQSGTSITIGAE
jgi:hypothetical protein